MSVRYSKSATWAFGAVAALVGIAGPLIMAGEASAKAGDVTSVGILLARPATAAGTWVVGGRSFTATAATELRTNASLTLGSCAKVKIRAGAVHEIDSQPMADCR